jgi:hypothetical protein
VAAGSPPQYQGSARAAAVKLIAAALAGLIALPLVVIVLVLGGTGGSTGAGPAAARPAAVVIPAGTVTGGGAGGAAWARSLLAAGGWPSTGCNVGAITAWERAEGSTASWHNPLDTTLREPGSRSVNSVGVQAYPSWQEGLAATIATLRGGPYGPILAALAAGNDARAVASAVAASPWGTEPFMAACTR